MAATCPRCARPVAMAQPRCVYCGAELPPDAVAAAVASRDALEEQTRRAAAAGTGLGTGGPVAEGPARTLLVLDLSQANAPRVAAATGVSAYEAAQWIRRGTHHLLRIVATADAALEADALRAQGLAVTLVDDEEVRAARPLVVTRGGAEGGVLAVRGDEGEARASARDLLLVVKGPIAREYQSAAQSLKRARLAGLEAGYRWHLHRKSDPRPIELDPAGFDFGREAGVISSVREIADWVARLFSAIPTDEGFRLLPPALAPGADEALDSMRTLAGSAARPGAGRTILDNLAQFRFYSGWRAALERRRAQATDAPRP